MNDKAKPAEPKLVEVILAKPHKHAGRDYAVGAKLRVTEPERDWLAAAKIIVTAEADKK